MSKKSCQIRFCEFIIFSDLFVHFIFSLQHSDVDRRTLKLKLSYSLQKFQEQEKTSEFELPYKGRCQIATCDQQQYTAFKAIEI